MTVHIAGCNRLPLCGAGRDEEIGDTLNDALWRAGKLWLPLCPDCAEIYVEDHP